MDTLFKVIFCNTNVFFYVIAPNFTEAAGKAFDAVALKKIPNFKNCTVKSVEVVADENIYNDNILVK